MINKLFNQNKANINNYLDLTSKLWVEDKKYHYIGFRQEFRPFKKSILLICIALCSLSLILPDMMAGFMLSKYILGRYG